MSAVYLSSPALRLRIADSPLSRRTFLILALIGLGALGQAAARGYPWLAGALAPLLAWLCWGLRHVPLVGAELDWSRGEWRIAVGGSVVPVELATGAVALPWVVLFPYRCAASRGRYLWVFADSVAPEDWRRLRVRIRLRAPDRGARW